MSEIVTACLSQFHDSENEFELLIGYADGREIGHLVTKKNAEQIAEGFARELGIAARIAALQSDNALLVEERDRLRKALEECEEYFDNRADADCDQDGYIPNDEMTMLVAVRSALEATHA